MLPPLFRCLFAAYHGAQRELGGAPVRWLLRGDVFERLLVEMEQLPPYENSRYDFLHKGLLFGAPVQVITQIGSVTAPICYRGVDNDLHIVEEKP